MTTFWSSWILFIYFFSSFHFYWNVSFNLLASIRESQVGLYDINAVVIHHQGVWGGSEQTYIYEPTCCDLNDANRTDACASSRPSRPKLDYWVLMVQPHYCHPHLLVFTIGKKKKKNFNPPCIVISEVKH